MRKLFTILALTIGLMACNHPLLANHLLQSSTTKTMNTTHNKVLIKNISLMAREERKVPSGLKPDSDRDISFANIFFELENTSEKETTVVIQKIRVRNTLSGKVELVDDTPKTIRLKPLEISAHSVQLAKKSRFSRFGKVNVALTIQIDDQTQAIESETVEIERH